jgi:hypothetical protein
MTLPVFRTCRIACTLALPAALLLAAATQAQQPRTIADCRAIQGELARYACYESLDANAGAAAAPAAPAAPAATPAAPSAPARPVTNLPVVRRPSLSVGDLTGETPAQDSAAAPGSTAKVQEQEEEKPGLLRRLLPFGGGDDEEDEQEEAPAAVATETPVSEVDNFGRRSEAGSARVETGKEGRKELIDTVASVREINASMLEVTLQGGQVWRQMISKRYPLREGDEVTIRPTIWGQSYRLTAKRLEGFIQVQRID